MPQAPLILISPDIDTQGKEHQDLSISLSAQYSGALSKCGALPVAMTPTIDRELIRKCVARVDGVVLTGGDDVTPALYDGRVPARIAATVNVTPDHGHRDLAEILIVDEVFRQRKPLLAICRGHQILNVALGGTLIADIPLQRPKSSGHGRNADRNAVVHDVRLTPGSLLAKITGGLKLGVNSTHHQAVGRVAPPLKATALSNDGIVEGLELKSGGSHWLPFLLSVQFHPERLVDRYPAHLAIFDAFARACGVGR